MIFDACFARYTTLHLLQENHREEACLSINDVGYIIYGGEIKFSDGTTLTLVTAFTTYLFPQHIMNAREKRGYFPATRNALKHDLIRHEIVMGDDERIAVDADPHGEMLTIIEKANHIS